MIAVWKSRHTEISQERYNICVRGHMRESLSLPLSRSLSLSLCVCVCVCVIAKHSKHNINSRRDR